MKGNDPISYLGFTAELLPDGLPGEKIIKLLIRKGLRIGVSENIAHIMGLTGLSPVSETDISNLVCLNSITNYQKNYVLNVAIPRNLPVFAHSNTFEPVEEIHILCDVVPQQIYGNTAKRLLACIAAVDKKPLRSTVKHVFRIDIAYRSYLKFSK